MKAKNHLSAIGWTVYVSLRTSCECAIKNQDHLDSFDHMGGSKIDGFKKSKRKAESFSCVDRPQKKARIEDVKSLCFDQKSDKDSSVVI
ncbi:hypothetical protein Tco_0545421 [Tanacetum coccineum]